MRYFTLAILIAIAAATGMLVGVMLAKPSGTTLAVTTQPREDQITLVASGHGVAHPNSAWIMSNLRPVIALATANYPANSQFRFEALMLLHSPAETCVRLFDLTAGSAVSGTELCHDTVVWEEEPIRLRSAAIDLSDVEHEYTLQGRSDPPLGGTVLAARIIVEWEEELVMEPGPMGVGGIVELRADTDAQSDQPASNDPLPVGASVALGVLVLGAGGLYAVRLRRG